MSLRQYSAASVAGFCYRRFFPGFVRVAVELADGCAAPGARPTTTESVLPLVDLKSMVNVFLGPLISTVTVKYPNSTMGGVTSLKGPLVVPAATFAFGGVIA